MAYLDSIIYDPLAAHQHSETRHHWGDWSKTMFMLIYNWIRIELKTLHIAITLTSDWCLYKILSDWCIPSPIWPLKPSNEKHFKDGKASKLKNKESKIKDATTHRWQRRTWDIQSYFIPNKGLPQVSTLTPWCSFKLSLWQSVGQNSERIILAGFPTHNYWLC